MIGVGVPGGGDGVNYPGSGGETYPPDPGSNGSALRVSDEGGHVITLAADWPNSGPYFVKFRNTEGDVLPLDRGAYGLVPGYADEVYVSGSKLRFGMPPLDSGIYDVLVFSGGLLYQTLPEAIEVVPRLRAWPIGYAFISSFATRWKLGPRRVELEDLATDANRPPYNPWQAVGKAFARVLNDCYAAPATRLREDLAVDATRAKVESTLRFDDARVRYVWVDGLHLRVFGVDHGTRELLLTGNPETEQTVRHRVIPGMSPVALDMRSIPHPGLFEEPVYYGS